MIIDIMDTKRFVKFNDLKEVSSSLFFDKSGTPYQDGLFSYDIFGLPGSYNRKNAFGYVDLKGLYIHPYMYNLFVSLNRKYVDLFTGEKMFIFNETLKDFEKTDDDNPNGVTGIASFYKFYDKVEFRETDSKRRSDKIELIKAMKKEEVFIDKFPVQPPFYRDANFETQATSEINKFYKKIIISAESARTVSEEDTFFFNYAKNTVQTQLNELHNFILGLIELKNGFLHKGVMGKTVDYGVRTLISAPTFTSNTYEELPASFSHASVPLSQIVGLFTIFMQTWVHDYIHSYVADRSNLFIYDPRGKTVKRVNLAKDWGDDYTFEEMLKKINLYKSSPEHRFDPVVIKLDSGDYVPFMFITDNKDVNIVDGKYDAASLKHVRYMTWTDLFYIAGVDVVKDKHVLITRYPLTDHHSEYFAKIKIRTTSRTMNMLIKDTMYNQYPVVDITIPKHKLSSYFIDSLEIFPPFIGTLGADHDGDQVAVKGIFTKEANEEADNYIFSIANMLGINGASVRKPEDIATHVLYNLTRDP